MAEREFDRTIAFIAGSGLDKGLEGILENVTHYENVENEYGLVTSYYVGYHGKTRVIILPRHGDKDFRGPAQLVRDRGYEANIWQLASLGVDAVYGFTAVGAIDNHTPLVTEKSFVVPHSYIRGAAASQHDFGKGADNIFTNMTDPFDPALRERAINAIEKAGYEARSEGLYIYNGGNTFETRDEIEDLDHRTRKHFFLAEWWERLVRKKRNRLVGMTTVPEAILLKQKNIPFAAIASNVNYGEGISPQTLVKHETTLAAMGIAEQYILNIVKEIICSYD